MGVVEAEAVGRVARGVECRDAQVEGGERWVAEFLAITGPDVDGVVGGFQVVEGAEGVLLQGGVWCGEGGLA